MLLRLNNDALEFFKDWELLVCCVDFRITLLLTEQKTYLLETLKLALNIAWILFDKLGEASHVRTKIRVLRIDNNDFAAHS